MTPRASQHPLAEYPIPGGTQHPRCSLPASNRAYLVAVLLEASLAQCAPFIRGKLLDVGCGNRPYERTYFSRADSYLGADYLADRSKPDVVCSALDLTFEDGSFDTVVSTEVLEHVPDPHRAVKEMRRVVKDDGHVILTTPFYWPRHEVPYDYFRYPYDGLLHIVQSAGLEVVRMFNRGRSYAFLGQVFQHVHPVPWAWFNWMVNQFFLRCDRHLRHDTLTLGWTVVARPSVVSGGGRTGEALALAEQNGAKNG